MKFGGGVGDLLTHSWTPSMIHLESCNSWLCTKQAPFWVPCQPGNGQVGSCLWAPGYPPPRWSGIITSKQTRASPSCQYTELLFLFSITSSSTIYYACAVSMVLCMCCVWFPHEDVIASRAGILVTHIHPHISRRAPGEKKQQNDYWLSEDGPRRPNSLGFSLGASPS